MKKLPYLDASFNSLCGFTEEEEFRDILNLAIRECNMEPSAADDTIRMMRTWYNGFCFSENEAELVYNPTLVRYFLDHFLRENIPFGCWTATLPRMRASLNICTTAPAEIRG